jgi:hypothetical protein
MPGAPPPGHVPRGGGQEEHRGDELGPGELANLRDERQALADACSRDDGTGCWLSAVTIARKAPGRRVANRLRTPILDAYMFNRLANLFGSDHLFGADRYTTSTPQLDYMCLGRPG